MTAQPMRTALRDGTVIEAHVVETGEWIEAAWNAAGWTYDADGDEVVTGRWEFDDQGGWLADGEVDAWRPSVARAIGIASGA